MTTEKINMMYECLVQYTIEGMKEDPEHSIAVLKTRSQGLASLIAATQLASQKKLQEADPAEIAACDVSHMLRDSITLMAASIMASVRLAIRAIPFANQKTPKESLGKIEEEARSLFNKVAWLNDYQKDMLAEYSVKHTDIDSYKAVAVAMLEAYTEAIE